jgi:hypothetical protein
MAEKMEYYEMRHRVLLSFQTALLDRVTSNLRGVCTDWDDKQIRCIFIFDHCPLDEEEELVSDIEGEVISHFLHHTIDTAIAHSISSDLLTITPYNHWVYRRFEG